MRNIENRNFETENTALVFLLNKAKNEERKDRALAVSLRLEAPSCCAAKHFAMKMNLRSCTNGRHNGFSTTARG